MRSTIPNDWGKMSSIRSRDDVQKYFEDLDSSIKEDAIDSCRREVDCRLRPVLEFVRTQEMDQEDLTNEILAFKLNNKVQQFNYKLIQKLLDVLRVCQIACPSSHRRR